MNPPKSILTPCKDHLSIIFLFTPVPAHEIVMSQVLAPQLGCWCSETPLLYKAVPSWFIRVEAIVSQLLENNQKC